MNRVNKKFFMKVKTKHIFLKINIVNKINKIDNVNGLNKQKKFVLL